jgi:thiol-disulfide isomerase/thioredoxin
VIIAGALVINSGASDAKEPPSHEHDQRIYVEAREDRALLDAMQGELAPRISGTEWFNTDARSLEDFRGKVVMVDFWGTWCAPCIKAVPKLKEWHEEYAERGLVILGVHSTRGGETVDAFIERYGLEYPIVIDEGNRSRDRYRVDKFPDVYFIDHEGVMRFADAHNANAKNLENAIELLLAEREASVGEGE